MNFISGIALLPLPVCFAGATRHSALDLTRNHEHFPDLGVADTPEPFWPVRVLELCTRTALGSGGRNAVLAALTWADTQ